MTDSPDDAPDADAPTPTPGAAPAIPDPDGLLAALDLLAERAAQRGTDPAADLRALLRQAALRALI
jgi:hypothetical protein